MINLFQFGCNLKIHHLPKFILVTGVFFCEEKQEPDYSYIGGWPVNPRIDDIKDPGFDLPCPGPTGCECQSDADCYNQNCRAHPKGIIASQR